MKLEKETIENLIQEKKEVNVLKLFGTLLSWTDDANGCSEALDETLFDIVKDQSQVGTRGEVAVSDYNKLRELRDFSQQLYLQERKIRSQNLPDHLANEMRKTKSFELLDKLATNTKNLAGCEETLDEALFSLIKQRGDSLVKNLIDDYSRVRALRNFCRNMNKLLETKFEV